MCARHRCVSNGGHESLEAEDKVSDAVRVLLCPECRGRVSLGHKEDPQAWLSHLPTRGLEPTRSLPSFAYLLCWSSAPFPSSVFPGSQSTVLK